MASLSPDLDKLPPNARAVIIADMAQNGLDGGDNPHFNFAPDKLLGIDKATAGDVFDNPPAARGALSRVAAADPGDGGGAAAPVAAPQMAGYAPTAPDSGALGALSATLGNMKVPSIQDAMEQFAPQEQTQRQMYLALAAGLGKATKTGSLGESISNAADALQTVQQEQQKLRMQYLPTIMNQMVAQQKFKQDMAFRQGLLGGMDGLTGQSAPLPMPGQPPGAPPQQGTPPQPGMPPQQGVAPQPSMPAPQSMPQGAGAPPPAQPPVQQGAQPALNPVQVAEVPKVQAAWQRMGFKYPLTQGELIAVVTSQDPQAIFGQLAQKHSEPTPEERMSINAGHMPGSPEYLADQRAILAAKTAPTTVGRNMYNDASGLHPGLPPPEDGYVWVKDLAAPGGFKQVPASGGTEAVQGSARAKALGGAEADPRTMYVKQPDGSFLPVQSTRAIQAQAGAGVAPGANTPAGAAAQTPGATLLPELPPTGQAGANSQVGQVDKSWNTVQSNNRTAQGTIRNLDNMIAQADTAITGPASSQLTFYNGLLALVNKRAATVAEATDLLHKNAEQIVSNVRLGQGGAGTDALQSAVAASNPNPAMIKGALVEASKEVKAVQQLNQAKASYLLPHYNNVGVNPIPYIANETAFDSNADARLWQLEHMPPNERAAFISKLPPGAAAELSAKRKALTQMGVFQ